MITYLLFCLSIILVHALAGCDFFSEHRTVSLSSTNLTTVISQYDPRFGQSSIAIDVDNNEELDLIVGAMGITGDDYSTGSIFIMFYEADITILVSHQKIDSSTGNFTAVLSYRSRFGRAITSLGDHDQDGTQDIAVTADGDGDYTGSLYLLFLNPTGTCQSFQKISSIDGRGGFTALLDINYYFGASVASVGDFNGDVFHELVVGVPAADEGMLFVIFLNSNATVLSHTKISATTGRSLIFIN